ncbi:MAG: sigma-54-dependent transcriptional regulator [Thermodesulfobacteriota bacterium]
MANVLIIDDDPTIQALLSAHVEDSENTPFVAGSLHEALRIAAAHEFDLVFLDVRLPDGNGLEALPRFRQLSGQPEVIIITAVGDAAGAELAIRSGAWNYIQKPATRHEISLQITRALQYREKHPREQAVALKRESIVGSSPQLTAALDLVAQSARSEANVLITGETGTGKELFAQTIHRNSLRADKPFVIVDCTALPETLIESLLFGHTKGAFTNADRDKSGLIERADKGTLFLDEIGELPLTTQKAFLRVLQERTFMPVGGSREMKSDFRLIAATNRDLSNMVTANTFRKDLLFRIKTFHVELPPLRERRNDIKEIAQHFVTAICERHRLQVKGFTSDFMGVLESYNWPGNVRELYHTLEKAILTDPGNPTLFPAHLPQEVRIHHAQKEMQMKRGDLQTGDRAGEHAPSPDSRSGAVPAEKEPLFGEVIPPLREYRQEVIQDAERRYMAHLLRRVGQDIKTAIEVAGVGQARFYALLKKYRLSRKNN